ncbi:hypothetical protein FOL47_008334 [Perkinsus chesapeaki]|uniref:Uncharacterized protein n=1 Tax=Perkinsus chesapeaki TaxID=330153 RepID=A0A7J6MTY4_PERCH|nr:hypothetical protein FOL47_008334 [Perkinsus chesapeaki]
MGCTSSSASDTAAPPAQPAADQAGGSDSGLKAETDVAIASNVTTGKPSVSTEGFPYLYSSAQDEDAKSGQKKVLKHSSEVSTMLTGPLLPPCTEFSAKSAWALSYKPQQSRFTARLQRLPGAGVDCFVSAVVGDNDIIPNLTPGVESLLREVLRGCCDYYDRVNVDLVFKVIETASKKVREKDWRLWKSLVGGASAKCVLRATLREQMLRWLLSREVDQIAGSQLLEGVLELADPHDTGVIERDNFIKATGLCGGTDILCSENIPTILSWIQRLNTSCHAGARESSTVASSKDDCELREFPYYVTDDSHSSTVTVPEVDAQSQLYRSTVTDMGPAYDVSGSTITELQQFPGESAQSVVAALLKPVHRRLWSSLVYITLGSNRNYMTKTPAVVSLLHLAVVRRIAWALSRMTARTMVDKPSHPFYVMQAFTMRHLTSEL